MEGSDIIECRGEANLWRGGNRGGKMEKKSKGNKKSKKGN